MGSTSNLECFLTQFSSSDFLLTLSQSGEFNPKHVQERVERYLNQVRYGYSVIRKYLPGPNPDYRILEVGAGSLILSLYLKALGYDAVGLEPSGDGFEFLKEMKKQVLDQMKVKKIDLLVIETDVNTLNMNDHGEFDFIFSIYVIEHIHDLEKAMSAMKSVVKKDGKMVHNFPNYLIPYEPHFSLPLFPFKPEWTKFIFKKQISQDLPLWESIEFLNSFSFNKISNKLDLKTEYIHGLLYDNLKRLEEDKVFRSRHPKLIYYVYLGLKYTGLLYLIKKMPAQLMTPLEVEQRP